VAFSGLFGRVVDAIEPHTEADPIALLLQLLTMFGNLIGRTAHFRAEADIHYLNLFTALVGVTSKGRKGTSTGVIKRLCEHVDPSWVAQNISSGLSSGEGLLWAVRDSSDRQQPVRKRGKVTGYESVMEDPGVTDKRLLVIESELARTLRVMGREGNTLSALMREAWDGLPLRSLTKNTPALATGAHISMIGHITADELRRYLDLTEAANGWGNRFLLACVRRSKLLPDGGGTPEWGPLVEGFKNAVDHARTAGELRRDSEARELWHREYERLSSGRPGLLGAMTGRAEAQVMRLACLFALGDLANEVRLPHLRAALEVWRYCYDSAASVFGRSVGDVVADQILTALSGAPAGLTRSEISRDILNRNRTEAETAHALNLLFDARLLTKELERTGGRPSERFFLLDEPGIGSRNEENRSAPRAKGSSIVNVVRKKH
jgi:Protein of unknown function (DUF3987)